MLTVEKIDHWDAFTALKDEWQELLAQCPHRTPFLTHDWMTIWWKHFGVGKELCVLVLREQGRAVLIAPMMKYWGQFYERLLTIPVLVIDTMANYHSNRVDWVYAELRHEYVGALWEYLINHERWHLLRLYPIPTESPTVAELRRLIARERIHATLLNDQTSPYLIMAQAWPHFVRHLPQQIMRYVKKAQRLLADRQLSVELYTHHNNVDDLIPQLFTIAEKGWAGARGTAISSTEQLRGFYTDLMRLANQRGWLLISLLKEKQTPIAFEYNLRYEQTVYNLKIAYDPAAAHYRPGHVLRYLTLSNVFEHQSGCREFDFLGDALAHKRLWTQQTRPHVKLTLYRPRHPYAQLLYHLQTKLLLPVKSRLMRALGATEQTPAWLSNLILRLFPHQQVRCKSGQAA